MKNLILLMVCTVLLLSFSGCSEKAVYSFADSDIYAYVNGEPVYESKMNQYIDMAKLYWQIEKEAMLSGESFEVTAEDEYDKADHAMVERLMDMAKEYGNLDDEGWEKEYYKTLLIKKALYDTTDFEENIRTGIDQTVADIRWSKEIVFANGGQDAALLLQPVADQYDLAYEECLDTVFKDFLTRLYEREMLLYSFPGCTGEAVKFDGTNADDYIARLKDVDAQFDAYLEALMENAEIVERP